MNAILDTVVPRQVVGSKTGASASMKCPNRQKAKALYAEALARLMNINQWAEISGALSASFQLCDKDGNNISAIKPEVGNLIRIALPAPGNAAGEGYDWVKILSIRENKDIHSDEDIYALTVRPMPHPDKGNDEVAHFYTSGASSTFVLLRKDNTVHAMEFGRNEIPNKKVNILNRWRNILVAWSARVGLAKPQWKALMRGILTGNEQK